MCDLSLSKQTIARNFHNITVLYRWQTNSNQYGGHPRRGFGPLRWRAGGTQIKMAFCSEYFIVTLGRSGDHPNLWRRRRSHPLPDCRPQRRPQLCGGCNRPGHQLRHRQHRRPGQQLQPGEHGQHQLKSCGAVELCRADRGEAQQPRSYRW